MRIRFAVPSVLTAVAACVVCGCASSPPADAVAAVQVSEINPYVGKPYEIVSPLWAGSWRTAFRLPTYPQRDDAIAALRTEAARLNANALISVSCLNQGASTWFKSDEPAYLCYGVAIRLPQSRG